MSDEAGEKIRVWDLPVRLFHWALVLLVTFSVTTGLIGGNWMLWHMRCGYTILALVAFRVLWGLVGTSTARFSDFVHGPRRVAGYTRELLARRPAQVVGHNPLGGWMVVALLAVLLVQAATGLFANDDIATEGPLYVYVSKVVSDALTEIHQANVVILYVLVALHVAAVLYHWFGRGENLVRPMLTGLKPRPPGLAQDAVRFSSPWLALGICVMAGLAVWLLVTLPPTTTTY